MGLRTPLVLGDDGLIQALQAGDSTAFGDGLAMMLDQNSMILRLLAPLHAALADQLPVDRMTDDEVNDYLGDIQS